jgi:hypothetical protein
MPRESLRQKWTPAHPINARDCCVLQCVTGVEAVDPGLHLPGPKGELEALAAADAGLGAEEGTGRILRCVRGILSSV